MNRVSCTPSSVLVGAALIACCNCAFAASDDLPAVWSGIEIGHWVEVTGEFVDSGRFIAEQIHVIQPAKYEVIFGRVEEMIDPNAFLLFGQPIQVTKKTVLHSSWHIRDGQRLKVTGRYRNASRFSARKIEYRHSGVDQIVGRVDDLTIDASGAQSLKVMQFSVDVPDNIKIAHDEPLSDIRLSQPRARARRQSRIDEDDLFGDGIRISENSRLAFQFESELSDEENLNLEIDDDEDELEQTGGLRSRLSIAASDSVYAVLEVKARYKISEETGGEQASDTRTELGETFVYLDDVFGSFVDLHIGRQDFDDEREWLYDRNLDGVRGIVEGEHVRAELAATMAINDRRERDRNSTNLSLYLSNTADDTHLAVYAIQRKFDLIEPETTLHAGLRAIASGHGRTRSWIDAGWMQNVRNDVRRSGFGLDMGATLMPWEFGLSLTAAYALGQGGDEVDPTQPLFRQTGFQDNNGRFAGITSFRYYGELVDPELSNLHIATIGVGYLSRRRRFSLDVVGHYYEQDRAMAELVDSNLDMDPNGSDPEIGWELDAILGWRSRKHWDVELIGAYFQPGAAFDDADDAMMIKLQIRWRY